MARADATRQMAPVRCHSDVFNSISFCMFARSSTADKRTRNRLATPVSINFMFAFLSARRFQRRSIPEKCPRRSITNLRNDCITTNGRDQPNKLHASHIDGPHQTIPCKWYLHEAAHEAGGDRLRITFTKQVSTTEHRQQQQQLLLLHAVAADQMRVVALTWFVRVRVGKHEAVDRFLVDVLQTCCAWAVRPREWAVGTICEQTIVEERKCLVRGHRFVTVSQP